MKKLAVFALCAAVMLSVPACGVSVSVKPTQGPQESGAVNPVAGTEPVRESDGVSATAPGSDPQNSPDSAVGTEPQPDPTPEQSASAEAKAIAMSMEGQSTSALFDAIGQPQSADYTTSCMGPGEDGNLYYDGFVVYTYREGGSEVIQYVE